MAYCHKSGAFISLLLASTVATAQVGPEIAYVKAGNRPEVHLVNANGTDHSLLYVAPRGTEIYHVDIRPGGGQLAIEEHAIPKGRSTIASTIKIIDYGTNGVAGTIRTHPLTCLTGSLDYHPTDGTLLYRDCSSPKRIARLNMAAAPMTSSDLGLAHDAFIASWLNATNILYWRNSGAFYTVSSADFSTPTSSFSHPYPGALDTATSGTRALSSSGSRIYLVDLTATPPPITTLQLPGQRGHFSPNDDYVIYVTGSEVGQKNQYVLIRETGYPATVTNVAGQGSFTAVDWRN